MKKFIKILSFCLVSIFVLSTTACGVSKKEDNGELVIFKDNFTGEKLNISKEERNQKLIEDVDFFKEVMLEFPSNFNHLSKDDFIENVEELKNNIPKLTDLEFIIELKKIDALCKEGHVNIIKDPKRLFLQMEKVLIGNEIHINSSYIDDEFKYGKLVKINDTDVETLKRKFKTVTSADNESSMLKSMDFADLDLLKGLGIVDDINKVNVTLEKNGKEKTFLIKPFIQNKNFPISPIGYEFRTRQEQKDLEEEYRTTGHTNTPPPKRKNAYNYEKHVDKKSIILNYNACILDEDKDNIEFFKELSEEIIKQKQEGNLKRIIVDVRRNGGGFPNVIKPFYEFLNEFFIENKDVNLVLLTDRPTFSGGIMTTTLLRKTTKYSSVAGMPCGGGLKFAGGVLEEFLPNSKIVMAFSTRYLTEARYDTFGKFDSVDYEPDTTEEEYSRNMLIPDFEAYKTVEDYENNTDSVVERALNGEFDKIK